MNILYCGDQDNAPAYIEGALQYSGHSVTHVAPNEDFPASNDYDVLILSDYPATSISQTEGEAVAAHIAGGRRLIMLGGWESFNGFGSNYYHHPIGSLLLPVAMSAEDDRVNAHQGLLLSFASAGDATTQPNWYKPPVICGYNDARAKEGAEVLVEMRPIKSDGKDVSLGEPAPLVVRGKYGEGTAVACLTDLAPHWSGGLTDWGERALQLSTGVQVGDSYPKFLQFLLEA